MGSGSNIPSSRRPDTTQSLAVPTTPIAQLFGAKKYVPIGGITR